MSLEKLKAAQQALEILAINCKAKLVNENERLEQLKIIKRNAGNAFPAFIDSAIELAMKSDSVAYIQLAISGLDKSIEKLARK